MKQLAIFDLDGTLFDMFAYLASATNFVLWQCGYPIHATDMDILSETGL